MTQLFTNNATSALAATTTTTATSLVLTTGSGVKFPVLAGADFFMLTLVGLNAEFNESSWEVVKVTGRSSDTLTVVRAQDNTSGVAWTSGTRVELRDTANTLSGFAQNVDNLSGLASAASARANLGLGAAYGYAALDSGNKVPSANLPSYVDDVLEYANLAAFPASGETGKIYTALDTNKIYRWSGSAYIVISDSPGSTDVVPEGSTNLYFSAARALAATVASYLGLAGGTLTGALIGTSITAKKNVLTPVALTSSSGSIAVDMVDSNFTHTLTENTVLANPTNLVAGQSGRIKFTNHASAPKTLAYGSYWLPVGGVVQALTASNSAVDLLVYEVDSSTTITFKLVKDRK